MEPIMKRSALVIDDSMIIRHTVCRYFEHRGFSVECAGNGAEALQILNNFHPDVIVTDLQMPELDGLQLISLLKKNPMTSAIPIVVLAARRQGGTTITRAPGDYLIFKDIAIQNQLQSVLEILFQSVFEPGISVN
jgi:CheY-like chemotaxis protein